MLLFGASGHANVISDILCAEGKKISALFDDDPSKKRFLQYNVVGGYDPDFHPDEELIISIGNNKIRKLKDTVIGHKYGVAIHPTAIISDSAIIHAGTTVMHGAIIQASANIGKHAIINTAASIDHECIIGDFVHISPGAILCGNVQVGEGTHIGAGAVVIPNIKIGKWIIIGAGTIVINDIPDYAVVVGNPGRIIKYNDFHE